MSDIDSRIKAELEKDTAAIDALLEGDDGGMPDMVAAAFKGSMRRWVWVTSVVTVIATAVMVWCGFEFYSAENSDMRIFWGVWFIASAMAQVALKQWQWMEMNRASLMREIKRLELAVAVLAEKKR
ncbi:DUF6768 family protein [Kordiimonas aquimaris]|uniref:DUF6768 family protein n=1 Tax=Kordiimonas aquimaris TaxID=707591 RepID=UPI0021CF7847|nr:DUF6768 family protein [Kordiimonas aquimaris]